MALTTADVIGVAPPAPAQPQIAVVLVRAVCIAGKRNEPGAVLVLDRTLAHTLISSNKAQRAERAPVPPPAPRAPVKKAVAKPEGDSHAG